MFVGFAYLLLSLAALAAWRLEPLCTSGACSALAQAGSLLGRPWWLWGALFYACAGALCLGLPKNRLTGAFLAAGTVFHAGLIAYGYAATNLICSICWKFAALGTLLAASYWLVPERRPSWTLFASAGPARALAVIALALLFLNPQSPTVQLRSQVSETQVSPENAQIAPKSVQEMAKLKSWPDKAEAAECYLTVTAPDGTVVCLDLHEKPALFFAVWCSHCPEALRETTRLSSEIRPYLVVTYLREGDAEKAEEKLAENGLAGETYYLIHSPPAGVQGVPSLVWWDDGLNHIEGAKTIAGKLPRAGVPAN